MVCLGVKHLWFPCSALSDGMTMAWRSCGSTATGEFLMLFSRRLPAMAARTTCLCHIRHSRRGKQLLLKATAANFPNQSPDHAPFLEVLCGWDDSMLETELPVAPLARLSAADPALSAQPTACSTPLGTSPDDVSVWASAREVQR